VDPSDVATCRRYLDFGFRAVVREISHRLYEARRYDLFMTVFKAPDLANHFFWANPATRRQLAGSDRRVLRAHTMRSQGSARFPLQPRRRAGRRATQR